MTAPAFRLEDVLSRFRSIESTDDAIVVLGDDEAMRVLVAWSHTDQDWNAPSRKPPVAVAGKMTRLWRWIVSGWEWDVAEIARLAGIPTSVAHAKLEMLIGNRLIYPDGSMSKGTRAALTFHTAEKLGIKQNKQTPPLPPKETATKKKKTAISDDDDDDDDDNSN